MMTLSRKRTPADAGARTDAGIGIRGKLFAAFAVVASMTLVASAVAFFSYGRIDESFGRVTSDGIPAIARSLDLARQAAEISAVSPAFLAADTPRSLDQARATLEEKRRAMNQGLENLGLTSIGRSAVEGLAGVMKVLDESMMRLADAVEKRLASAAQRERATAQALTAHEGLIQAIIPLVDDAGFNLVIGLETAADPRNAASVPTMLARLADQEARSLMDLADLRAESNLVLGLLSEASLAPRAELLGPLRDRFTAGSTRALKAAAGLKGLPQAAEVRKLLDGLIAPGKGQDSIFDLRQRELRAAADSLEIVKATRGAAARVSEEVGKLVALAQSNSNKAVEASGGTIEAAKGLLSAIALVSLVLAAAIAWFYVGRGVVRRLARLNTSMLALARGDLAAEVPHEGRDELSAMAEAVEVFKRNALTTSELEAEQRQAQEQREQRHRAIETHIAHFHAKIGTLLQALTAASRTMGAAAEAMSARADEASRQAVAVAAASGQTTDNVQMVAAAAEEMSATVAEISHQITQSSTIAGRAVVEAKRTDSIVRGLADGASKIGEVVELIQDIAGQTNLLALNATIEAARAGEAGRGFAVVASEVKALANQTGKATEEIAAQIAAIQSATREAVGAIQGIGGTIDEINQISTAIAAAMNEQGATTGEIARSTQHAAAGTQQVSQSIGVVSEAASKTGHAADEVLGAANDLGGQADELRAEVDRFLAHIRAA